MILVEDKIEGINVTVEIDETEDHHNWGGCPVLNTENYTRLFEAVDVLTVIKAVKTCKTVEEFISKVENTWSKDKIAEPIIRELNDLAIDKVFDETIKVLDYTLSEENKELLEFGVCNNAGLYRGFCHSSLEFEGEFYKIGKDEQIRFLVQSALADC